MAGFSQGGGVGLALANWMVDGDPGHDIWGMDVARYGDWATLAYTNAKVRENYSRRFRIRFPNEELPAARPLRTTPIYDRLVAENAVLGDYCGLENPLWFAPKGVEPREDVDFPPLQRASRTSAPNAARCAQRVGLTEIANYGKIEVDGPAAPRSSCSHVMAEQHAAPSARIALTPMLNERGRLIGDFTIGRYAEDKFLLVGSLRRGAVITCAGSSGTCRRAASPCAPPRWIIPACRSPARSARDAAANARRATTSRTTSLPVPVVPHRWTSA